MFRKLSAVCISLACLTMVWPALAEDEAGNKSGASENRGSIFASYSYGITKLGRERVSAISNSAVDDNDYGYRIAGGLQSNSGLILGFAYNDFGTAELSSEMGGLYALDGVEQMAADNLMAEVTATSYGPYIAYNVPLTVFVERGHPDPPFSLTPKIGLHFWEVESTVTRAGRSVTWSDDDIDVYYGADLNYRINNRLSLMLGYDQYRISGDTFDYLYLGTQVDLFRPRLTAQSAGAATGTVADTVGSVAGTVGSATGSAAETVGSVAAGAAGSVGSVAGTVGSVAAGAAGTVGSVAAGTAGTVGAVAVGSVGAVAAGTVGAAGYAARSVGSAGISTLEFIKDMWAAVATADSETGFFGGRSVPYLDLSYGETKLGAEAVSAASGSSFKDEDNGYRILGGVRYGHGLMLGFAYTDFGAAEFKTEAGGEYTLNGVAETSAANFEVEISTTSYGPYIAYNFPLAIFAEEGHPDPPLSFVPKAGLHVWNLGSNSRGGTTSFALNDDGIDAFYGADLTYKFTDYISLMLGYDQYRVAGDTLDYVYLGTRFFLY